jgi:DNA-directed RNA polymerase subunit F
MPDTQVSTDSENQIAEQTATSTTDENKASREEPMPQQEEEAERHQPTAEELEWNKMSGPVQKRVRNLLEERNNLRNEVQTIKAQIPYAPQQVAQVQPTTSEEVTPEQQQAVENLRKFGILTTKDLQEVQDQLTLDSEYMRLETRYSGDDGKPVFDRSEVERHMRDTGIYNPEKAYEDLYRDELFDWRSNQMSQRAETPRQTYSERPSASTQSKTEPLTVDGLRQRLAQPDGREWWDKNREKILPIIGSLLQE